MQSSSHTLDTVLTTDCTSKAQSFHIALGIDLPDVLDSGISWAAEQSLQLSPMPLKLPQNIRLVSATAFEGIGSSQGLRLQLLESCGHESQIKLNFNREVKCVYQNGEMHKSGLTKECTPGIDGKTVDCLLRRYEMASLEIIFCEDHHT